MQSMSVQTAQVMALSSEIRNGSARIREEIDRLESEVSSLRAAWSGESQQAYDIAQAQWNKSLVSMQELLTRIATGTEQIAQQYDASDRRNANRFA